MLDRIRTHAQGWIVKAILGSMTIGLIFYFGYSGLSRSGGKNASGGNIHAATVNGEIIPQKKLEALVQKQMEFYRQVNQGALPPALVESIKTNALERLIENKLLAEQAKKIGMTVSDKELAQEITSNPQFIKDGVFNKKFYLEVVKPNYERQMGDDYETDLREEILVDKFETFIKNSIQLSDQELHDEFVQSQTQLNLLKITLDNTQWKDQPESAPKADNAKTEILNALKSPAPAKGPAPLDTLKKKYSLKSEETGFHSLRDKTAFVGLPNTPEIFKCVAQLNASNNVCSEAFTLGNQIVFLKLIERKEADMSQFDAEKENIKKTLLARKQVLQLKEIKEGLIKEASIKTYLGKKSS